MRRIAYVGSAQREDVEEDRAHPIISYGIGDIIPTLPLACPNLLLPGASQSQCPSFDNLRWCSINPERAAAVTSHLPQHNTVCSGLDFVKPTADGISQFNYTLAGGNVPFFASDMRNAQGWRRAEDFVVQAVRAARLNDVPNGIIATHLCE